MPLAAWDPAVFDLSPAVFDLSLAVFDARQPPPSAAAIFGCANLVRFAAGGPLP
jgi:hypothetical protein